MKLTTVRGPMPHPGVQKPNSEKTAVYRLFNGSDQLLYVGMGRNPMGRWSAHAEQHPWWPDVAHFTVHWFDTRKQAADEERRALRTESPLHNIHGTPRHGLITGAGVRAALAGRRNFSERSAPAQPAE